MLRALSASLICVALGAADLRGQLPDVSAYYFHLGSGSSDSPVSDAGVSDFQRLRLMSSPGVGPLTLDVAYEHTLLLNSTDVLGTGSGILVPEASGNWLTLGWTADDGGHFSWRHRFDRLSLALPLGDAVEASVGRQVVSWASTFILTPADPFTPFDPADPFREYRAGVDAVRLKLRGKPAPDTFLEAARQLGVEPQRSVVVEDALSGVQAGRDGGFGLVIGVDRHGARDALQQHGAHLVVGDLGELL